VLAVLTPSAQHKLGKLLRLLSSDKDGEVLAAASAIMRTLAAEGSDIHNLADTLCRPAAHRAEERAQRASASADCTDWREVARECEAHIAVLNERERKFVNDMTGWRTTPSEKQQAWLLSILTKVRRRG
jgi:hypothetical protein